MKKLISLIATAIALTAAAQTNIVPIITTGTTTNTTVNNAWLTVWGTFTNKAYTAINSNSISVGEPTGSAFNKVNTNFTFLQAEIDVLKTNPGNAGIRFTNTVTGAPGTAVIVTNWQGMVGVFQLTVPAGAAGTNTITVQNFSNQVLNSVEIVTYQSNYTHWAASNKLARVAGLTRWRVNGGSDGGNPPKDIPIYLIGSLSGSNGWFTITNGYWTPSNITVSAICALTNAISGMAQATPGAATLYSMDHLELMHRTNSFDGQTWLMAGSPVASQAYVATAIANALDGHFVGNLVSNVYHLTYSHGNGTAFDLASTSVILPINSVLDGTGTNLLITTPVTNLVSGWTMVSSTNLLLVNGFITYTNYSTNITSGILTLTVPIVPGEDMRFYMLVGPGVDSLTIGPGVTGNVMLTNTPLQAAQFSNLVCNYHPAFLSASGIVYSNDVGILLPAGRYDFSGRIYTRTASIKGINYRLYSPSNCVFTESTIIQTEANSDPGTNGLNNSTLGWGLNTVILGFSYQNHSGNICNGLVNTTAKTGLGQITGTLVATNPMLIYLSVSQQTTADSANPATLFTNSCITFLQH